MYTSGRGSTTTGCTETDWPLDAADYSAKFMRATVQLSGLEVHLTTSDYE